MSHQLFEIAPRTIQFDCHLEEKEDNAFSKRNKPSASTNTNRFTIDNLIKSSLFTGKSTDLLFTPMRVLINYEIAINPEEKDDNLLSEGFEVDQRNILLFKVIYTLIWF